MQQLSFLPGEMTPGERSLILRALKTLDRHLHEPGVAFTSTRAAREWLILNMAGLEREEFRVLYLNNQNQLIAGEPDNTLAEVNPENATDLPEVPIHVFIPVAVSMMLTVPVAGFFLCGGG